MDDERVTKLFPLLANLNDLLIAEDPKNLPSKHKETMSEGEMANILTEIQSRITDMKRKSKGSSLDNTIEMMNMIADVDEHAPRFTQILDNLESISDPPLDKPFVPVNVKSADFKHDGTDAPIRKRVSMPVNDDTIARMEAALNELVNVAVIDEEPTQVVPDSIDEQSLGRIESTLQHLVDELSKAKRVSKSDTQSSKAGALAKTTKDVVPLAPFPLIPENAAAAKPARPASVTKIVTSPKPISVSKNTTADVDVPSKPARPVSLTKLPVSRASPANEVQQTTAVAALKPLEANHSEIVADRPQAPHNVDATTLKRPSRPPSVTRVTNLINNEAMMSASAPHIAPTPTGTPILTGAKVSSSLHNIPKPPSAFHTSSSKPKADTLAVSASSSAFNRPPPASPRSARVQHTIDELSQHSNAPVAHSYTSVVRHATDSSSPRMGGPKPVVIKHFTLRDTERLLDNVTKKLEVDPTAFRAYDPPIPYDELVKTHIPNLDSEHLEVHAAHIFADAGQRYLSEADCLRVLGCSKVDIEDLPARVLIERKREAALGV